MSSPGKEWDLDMSWSFPLIDGEHSPRGSFSPNPMGSGLGNVDQLSQSLLRDFGEAKRQQQFSTKSQAGVGTNASNSTNLEERKSSFAPTGIESMLQQGKRKSISSSSSTSAPLPTEEQHLSENGKTAKLKKQKKLDRTKDPLSSSSLSSPSSSSPISPHDQTQLYQNPSSSPTERKTSTSSSSTTVSKTYSSSILSSMESSQQHADDKKGQLKRTPVACLACHKAKTSCSADRPCKRCIRIGKPHECCDRPHMKKGRPRKERPAASRRGKKSSKSKELMSVSSEQNPIENRPRSISVDSMVSAHQSVSLPPSNFPPPSVHSISVAGNSGSHPAHSQDLGDSNRLPMQLNRPNEYNMNDPSYFPRNGHISGRSSSGTRRLDLHRVDPQVRGHADEQDIFDAHRGSSQPQQRVVDRGDYMLMDMGSMAPLPSGANRHHPPQTDSLLQLDRVSTSPYYSALVDMHPGSSLGPDPSHMHSSLSTSPLGPSASSHMLPHMDMDQTVGTMDIDRVGGSIPDSLCLTPFMNEWGVTVASQRLLNERLDLNIVLDVLSNHPHPTEILMTLRYIPNRIERYFQLEKAAIDRLEMTGTRMPEKDALELDVNKLVYERMPFGIYVIPLRHGMSYQKMGIWFNSTFCRMLGWDDGSMREILRTRNRTLNTIYPPGVGERVYEEVAGAFHMGVTRWTSLCLYRHKDGKLCVFIVVCCCDVITWERRVFQF